jgi:AcrR family transcriptional regulator
MEDEDPRIVRTRNAVLHAATDLLVEGGPAAVTMDAVVARSGVAKSTIYRHWSSRDEVLVDVFAHCAPNLEVPDAELPFEGALRAFVSSIVTHFSDPQWARIVPALLMLKSHAHGVEDLEKRLEKNQSDALAAVLKRGIDEGVLRAGLDVDEAVAHLVGPLLFAHLTGSVPLDHAFADRTVDVFLAAYGHDQTR